MSANATGSNPAPALNGLKPSTNWMYWVRKNSEPNMAKKTSVTAIDAAENRGFAKNVTSSIGSGVWSSQRMNPTSIAPPIDERGDDRGRRPSLARPFDDAEEQTGERADRQHRAEEVDGAWRSGPSSSGTRNTTATTVTMTTGMLTRNTEPHQKWVRR